MKGNERKEKGEDILYEGKKDVHSMASISPLINLQSVMLFCFFFSSHGLDLDIWGSYGTDLFQRVRSLGVRTYIYGLGLALRRALSSRFYVWDGIGDGMGLLGLGEVDLG